MNLSAIRLACFVLVSIAISALTGCTFGGSAGSLRTASLGGEPVVLRANFKNVYFRHDLKGETSFMLTDVPLPSIHEERIENGQFMHVQLLWLPKPGSTPMDPTATNASIRYVVISGGEVGVYSGAGFAMPDGDLTGKRATLTLYDATLQLQDSTPGFRDLLSPAQMTGSFTAQRDEKKTLQLNRAASQFVTNALGKTKFVLAN